MVAANEQFLSLEASASLADLLRWRAQREAGRCAYSFPARQGFNHLTYGELGAKVRRLSSRLEAHGLRGERIIVSLPTCESFVVGFFACLDAGATAVPVFPPRNAEDGQRTARIAGDAQAKAFLTTRSGSGMLAALDLGAVGVADARFLSIEEEGMLPDPQSPASCPRVTPIPAMLQYTSGSTGAQKGVALSHANLLANLESIRRTFGNNPQRSRGVSWLPPYHDMGLIGGILQPLYIGAPTLLLEPMTFVRSPWAWLEAIQSYRATTSGGPNFAFDLCVRRVPPEKRAALDLSTWELAFCGSEPIRGETLEAFAQAFAPAGFRREAFYPCYGLAESTLLVAGPARGSGYRSVAFDAIQLARGRAVLAERTEIPRAPLVSCGSPVEDARTVIVDPETHQLKAPGEVGEIWTSGPSVAMGYWNNNDETKRTFRATLAGAAEVTYLRTGDLGVLWNGHLFVTGRLKDLIIVRGVNHYPQDIEATVQGCGPSFRKGRGVAFAVTGDRGEELVIVQEIERAAAAADDLQGLLEQVRESVTARHGIRPSAILLVPRSTVVVTSSGKLRRRTMRDCYLSGELQPIAKYVASETDEETELQALDEATTAQGEPSKSPDPAPQAPGAHGALDPRNAADIEQWMIARLAELLRRPASTLGPDESFAQLGVDSMMAMEAIVILEEALQLAFEPADMYRHRTPRAFARWCASVALDRAGERT
jgi:acyl-CoA synthetase (AMP-forming)/AMP-acid ligase II/acyl carrier protein